MWEITTLVMYLLNMIDTYDLHASRKLDFDHYLESRQSWTNPTNRTSTGQARDMQYLSIPNSLNAHITCGAKTSMKSH